MVAKDGINIKISVDNRQGVAAVGEQARAFSNLSLHVGKARQSIASLTVAFTAGQLAFSALSAAIKGIAVALPNAAIASERVANAFKVLTGSAAAAVAEQRFVRDEAQRLGISLDDAADAYLKLAAAARGTALEGEPARRVFSAVSGAAAALGLSGAEASGALLAISQMMSKGTVQAEELRGQLGERIPGAFQIAARAMGVSTAELSAMLDRGQILADDFLPKFADQLAREIPASANTFGATMQRIGNMAAESMQLIGAALADAIEKQHGLQDATKDMSQYDGIVKFAHKSAKAIAAFIDVARELILFVPNVLKTVGGSVAAVARDLKLAFDIAAAVVTEGVGEKGRAAMARALEERNRFIDAYNKDMMERWFPKQLTERVDTFFAELKTKASSFQPKAVAARRPVTMYAKSESGIDAARLAATKDVADAELSILKDGLERQKTALEAALEDRLVSIRSYYAQKTLLEQREVDVEIARQRALLAEQKRLAASAKTDADRIRAKGEVAKIEADLIVLNNRRADVEQANARASAKAEKDLADALAQARAELAQITGTATDADRKAAIERSYSDLKARLAAEGDTHGVSLVDRLIDVKTAQANLAALEDAWRLAQARMRNAQDAAKIAFDAGLITQSEYQARIAQTSQEASAALGALLPQMEAAANVIGSPESLAHIQAWKNELATTQMVIDPIAQSINTSVKDAFTTMFEQIGTGAKTAKNAFLDFASSVIGAIQRIAAQKLAEQIFSSFGGSGGGFGGLISGLFGFKFASGGQVPGSGTSDTVPAMLTPGEYVIRRDVVARYGRALFDALNELRLPPAVLSGRLAFAAGGLVPAMQQAPTKAQSVRIVNVVDPALASDWLNSSAGERTILNILQRNAGAVKQVLA